MSLLITLLNFNDQNVPEKFNKDDNPLDFEQTGRNLNVLFPSHPTNSADTVQVTMPISTTLDQNSLFPIFSLIILFTGK